MSETTIPRPGVKPIIIITFDTDKRMELQEIEMANLESDINDRFLQPSELGKLELTFRSNVTQNLTDEIAVITTSSLMTDSVLQEISELIEDRLNVNVESWEIDTRIERKRFGDIDLRMWKR